MSTRESTLVDVRRNAERVKVLPTDLLTVKVHADGEWTAVLPEDISVGGIAYRSNTLRAAVGDLAMFELRHRSICIRCKAIVRHQTGNLFGFEFDRSDSNVCQSITAVVTGFRSSRRIANESQAVDNQTDCRLLPQFVN